MNCKFKVGDEIKGISNNYGITNKDMKRGKVIGIPSNGKINIEVLEHIDSYWIGETFTFLGDEDFELVETDQITINRYGNKVVAKMGKKVGVARCNETDEFDLYTGVKIAVERIFGKDNEVKEVKRQAKVGEYVKIVCADECHHEYENGDILKIIEPYSHDSHCIARYGFGIGYFLFGREYVVLENYKPQEEPKEEKPKYYNGKVVCVESAFSFATVGKIYEFKDGLVTFDDGIESNVYKNVNDFNTRNKSIKLIELVE